KILNRPLSIGDHREFTPHLMFLVREALQEHQVRCELTVITDGERAIQYLDEIDAGQHTCPSLFVLDLNLPRKPGKAVLQHIRASKVCGKVPVIILTSSDSQRDKDEVASLSPSQYIRKPSSLDEFVKLG